MKQEIKWGIGTNMFYHQEDYNINTSIKKAALLGVKAIEVYFEETELTKESLDLLKEFEFISIHAPVVDYRNDEETKRLLKRIEKLSDLINARGVTFHPNHFDNFDVLLNFNINVCIENPRPGLDWDFERFKKLFEKYPKFRFVLDVCHARMFSGKEIKLLFNEFKNKINHFHLSGIEGDKRHVGLHLIDEEELALFSDVINFGKPLIIELWKPDIEMIKEELKFFKSKFN